MIGLRFNHIKKCIQWNQDIFFFVNLKTNLTACISLINECIIILIC